MHCSFTSFSHNSTDIKFVLHLYLPAQTQIRTPLRATACLGLLAVRKLLAIKLSSDYGKFILT